MGNDMGMVNSHIQMVLYMMVGKHLILIALEISLKQPTYSKLS